VPLIAFVIAYISGLSDAEKTGVVLVSLCASGASSNLVTHLFKGNVALAISMTTINSFITLLSIPILTNVALKIFMGIETEVHLPVGETILQIFIITIVPAAIGVYIRRIKENIAIKLEKPLKYVLTLLLAMVFTIKIFFGEASGGTGISFTETIHILPFMLLLNVLAMASGLFIAKILKLSFTDQFTISIEVGLHNTALALLIGGTILNMPEIEKPAVVYAMFSFFTAVIFVYLVKKFTSRT
jgi:bile acid:Na+ symporter, BASS family